MSRKVQRVQVELHPHTVNQLPVDEIKMILRGADDLIGTGGRTLLAKILKGSRDKKVLELGLDQNPAYGYYQQLSLDDITARIDWTIARNYLAIEYSGRLPLLIFSEKGWEIERETYARELLHGFDEMLAAGTQPYDMEYLKDRNRGMILLLLDLVEASRKKEYIPILKAWEQIDHKKVSQRIREVIGRIEEKTTQSQHKPDRMEPAG